jgi:hypothetical protein
METKNRSAAIAAVYVLLLVMLSGEVAAMSKFCACYTQCYPKCRVHVERFGCVPFCANKCSPSQATAAVGDGDSCWAACAVKICGLEDPPSGKTTTEPSCLPRSVSIIISFFLICDGFLFLQRQLA